MIQKVFAVYDCKAMAFLQPFFSINAGSAIRAFGDVVNQEGPIGKHPGDYQLYELGTFDDQTGGLVAVVPTKLLGVGTDFVQERVPSRMPPKEFVESVVGSNGSREA